MKASRLRGLCLFGWGEGIKMWEMGSGGVIKHYFDEKQELFLAECGVFCRF